MSTTFLQVDTSSHQSIEESFCLIADTIFNKRILVVNGHLFRLLEIEFYYHNESCTEPHADNYTHKHVEQMRAGIWYFHGSGLDITFGGEGAYGGILLRGIQRITERGSDLRKEDSIIGPLKVVAAVFSCFQPVESKQPNQFYLHDNEAEPMSNLAPIPCEGIIQTQRIGLNPKRDMGANRTYHDKPYRFLIHPHLPHKNKAGIVDAIYRTRGSDPSTLGDIKRLMGGEYLKHNRVK